MDGRLPATGPRSGTDRAVRQAVGVQTTARPARHSAWPGRCRSRLVP